MIRDENGIAVPNPKSLLPLDISGDLVLNDYGDYVCQIQHPDDADFLTHAAKFHPRLADIVRRLAVWHEETRRPSGTLSFKLFNITSEAAKVWAEMREDGVE